jgi:hypothetical protein
MEPANSPTIVCHMSQGLVRQEHHLSRLVRCKLSADIHGQMATGIHVRTQALTENAPVGNGLRRRRP